MPERGLEAVLAAHAARAVIGVGVAGGLTPDLRCGDVVVAREVRDEHASLGTLDGGWRARAVAAGARTAVLLSVDRVITGRAREGGARRAPSRRAGAPSISRDSRWRPRSTGSRRPGHGRPGVAASRACWSGGSATRPTTSCRRCSASASAPDGGIDRRRLAARLLREPRAWPAVLRMRWRRRSAAERVAELVETILRAVPEKPRGAGELLFADPASATSGDR